ncbi:MAG TPA: IS110 family transposase [Chloroflexota bacterium]|nr:IS110 family transposase [Chloroflexota bacterium]
MSRGGSRPVPGGGGSCEGASLPAYWQPISNLGEDEFTLLLAHARHLKTVPGRKTDVRDCEWIADLLRHGLLRASFGPARPQRELRELPRYRTTLVQERSAEIKRLQKTLEGANIKLAAVASNVAGVSGRQILAELLAGTTNPAPLAELARGRLRDKRAQLEQALTGQFRAHHRFLVAQQLAHRDARDGLIEEVSVEVERRLRPVAADQERLDTIPGIGRRGAEILLAELGTELGRFGSAAQLASWAGLCPGNRESAGTRLSGRTRHGNPWLRSLRVEAAQAAGRTQTYLGARFRRLAARKGRKRAAVAVAHDILRIVYYLLTRQTTVEDLGVTYLEQRDRQAVERRAVRRLESLGYTVTLKPTVPAA